MKKKPILRRSARSACFCLSARGEATEAAYRANLRSARGSSARSGFEQARTSWAFSHGLSPDDGAYLSELHGGPASLASLGEALAVCGQSREAVKETMSRLLELDFIEPVPGPPHAPSLLGSARAHNEVAIAEAELALVRLQFQVGPSGDRRLVSGSLREAVFRVVVAKRFLAKLARSG